MCHTQFTLWDFSMAFGVNWYIGNASALSNMGGYGGKR